MPFNAFKSVALNPGGGTLVVPASAVTRPEVACTNLKGAVHTIAQLRDALGTAAANLNILDISNVGRIQIQPRLANVAGITFGDARFAVIGGFANSITRDTDGRPVFSGIQLLRRLDSTDLTTAITGTSGIAAGIPASPSSANMMVAPGAAPHPGYLVGNPVLFTDALGNQRPYLDVSAFNFLLTPLLVASTGGLTTGETGELIVSSAN